MQSADRSEPDLDGLDVWRRYIETAESLRARLAKRLFDESALSIGDYQVLSALVEAPGRTLRSSELATAIDWERSRLSHQLGRMQKRDLIDRSACPNDPHGVEVSITATGAAMFGTCSTAHRDAIRDLFVDALSADQLAHLDALSTALREHLGLDALDDA